MNERGDKNIFYSEIIQVSQFKRLFYHLSNSTKTSDIFDQFSHLQSIN